MFGTLKRKEISSQETKTAAFNTLVIYNSEVQIKCDVRLIFRESHWFRLIKCTAEKFGPTKS